MTAPTSALGRFGEIVLVGVLTCLCSVPLITAAAAQAAAFRTLDERHAGAPGMTATYASEFGGLLRRGVRIQAVWLVPAVIAAVDLWFGLRFAAWTLPWMIFCTIGGVGMVTVVLVRPCLAARLSTETFEPVSCTLRRSFAIAGVSPWRTLLAAALDLGVVAAGAAALIATPLAAGCALALQRRLLVAADRRLATTSLGAAPRPPQPRSRARS